MEAHWRLSNQSFYPELGPLAPIAWHAPKFQNPRGKAGVQHAFLCCLYNYSTVSQSYQLGAILYQYRELFTIQVARGQPRPRLPAGPPKDGSLGSVMLTFLHTL